MTTTPDSSQERADLVQSLRRHRYFLRHTVQGLTDEQARLRPTASALCLGGLIKHVAATERQWADFAVRGEDAMPSFDGDFSEEQMAAWTSGFELLPTETLAGVLAEYQKVAAATDGLVTDLPDLDLSHPLPPAPWFEPGARWSARRVFLHIVAETSQHAGHADILRESIDGAKTMG